MWHFLLMLLFSLNNIENGVAPKTKIHTFLGGQNVEGSTKFWDQQCLEVNKSVWHIFFGGKKCFMTQNFEVQKMFWQQFSGVRIYKGQINLGHKLSVVNSFWNNIFGGQQISGNFLGWNQNQTYRVKKCFGMKNVLGSKKLWASLVERRACAMEKQGPLCIRDIQRRWRKGKE